MDAEELNERLSRISTLWTLVFQAHAGPVDAVTSAQRLLMQRYSGAVYRYLLGAVRDPDVAAELSQEFALRFVRGDYRRADPHKGRFRDYLKTALSHLITDYYRSRQAWPRPLDEEAPEPAASEAASESSDRDFLEQWRAELLDRTWRALDKANAYYRAVLLLRIEQPDLTSAEMAEQLGRQLGKAPTAAWVRKALQRAHARFADLLLEEVVAALENPTEAEVEQELRTLDLLKYCRSAWEHRRGHGSGPEA
jgi:RNA polymerase sigma-70 factor (ECF subfamily)